MCITRPDRENGLTWPTNILQVLAVFILVTFTVVHFVLVLQYTYGVFFYLMMITSTIFCAATVISKTVCTLSNPADRSLIKDPKSTYGKEKPLFDRAKQGHVINTDNYCQICTTTVDVSSRHCSQCQKCILRFDHHCDYINNCVGRRNYKYYITLLMSASIYSLIVFTNILYIIYHFCFMETQFFKILGRDHPTIFGYKVSSATIISLLVIFLVLAVIAFIWSQISADFIFILFGTAGQRGIIMLDPKLSGNSIPIGNTRRNEMVE
ncbi:palmitoyltransferase ZDHHC1-like [Bolinopsis microptera]|uniref:palmitoyltransferase ZDHHC1-like n=1 Tax=Bolinopsis microptera TaxID=2820187 RepID=UPI00307AA41A